MMFSENDFSNKIEDENEDKTSIATESDLESDSSETDEDDKDTELTYKTVEVNADLLYAKVDDRNRVPTSQATKTNKLFYEKVLRYVIQKRQEQPVSLPAPYLIGSAPAPKNTTKKSKIDEKEPSPKRARHHSCVKHQQMEIERKRSHPAGLHTYLLFNEPHQQNDGPFCKCYEDSRDIGVIHNVYPGETIIPYCNLFSNNISQLYHYVVEVSPDFPLKNRQRSVIRSESGSYTFSGFSLFFHKEVPKNLPRRWLNRMFPEYAVKLFKAPMIENFCIYELELFYEYFFQHLLELHDINRGSELKPSCPYFHIMPRFVNIEVDVSILKRHKKQFLAYDMNSNKKAHPVESNDTSTHNLLPMSYVLNHLISNFNHLSSNPKGSVSKARRWLKGQLVTCPSKKPACIRVDDLIDGGNNGIRILHQTQLPSSQSSFARQQYFNAQRRYHTLVGRLKAEKRLSDEDSKGLTDAFDEMQKYKEEKYQRHENRLELPMRQFHSTGIYGDMVQHAFFALTICGRVRYHWSLSEFEKNLKYTFNNRLLLELALTHPSNLTNYGTNSDHARNTLRNCGLRDIRNKQKAKKSQDFERRKGVSTLMKIMAKFGSKEERQSTLHHNERLEFLGDAIVELLTSHHLFYMMPYAEEGVLASHRSKLVRNINLGQVGRRLQINKFLLHLHGPDLSQFDGMTKAMANAFEALMAAIYLDSDIDDVLAQAFFGEVPDLFGKWTNLNEHPLKQNSPSDRHWIERVKWLQKLNQLEEYTGIFFHHIRVLARAFTRRQVGYNNLTQGHNQRLEFLGDTILQFFVSDHLYRHFPRHQEGHLSLLRSCLVSNKTQSVICDDLRLTDYLFDLRNPSLSTDLTLKDKADLVESYLGAIFVDRGFDFCEAFCRVCFFPRLHTFIRSSRWNDPKSQLQQCCLTLRRRNTAYPDIPEYRTVGVEGPTNTREFRVLVFFRNKRLASGIGHTIHAAELNAAENALIRNAHLFGNFDLENTYLGTRIKEYDEKIEEKIEKFASTKVESDEESVEDGELVEKKEQDLMPVTISSDSDSD